MTDAAALTAALEAIADPEKVAYVARFYKGGDPATQIMGVPMPKVFPLAKQFAALTLADIETLLDDTRYEVRMAAVAVMDFQARRKTCILAERKALFDLYLRRHDRINNWDLVDRAAPHVIGEYLLDKDRAVLDRLALSDNPHERRTALVSTYAFIKKGEISDTFRIAEILADDPDPYVQKAIGSWVREAGKQDQNALVGYLTRNAIRLPRTTITAAAKHLTAEVKARLRQMSARQT